MVTSEASTQAVILAPTREIAMQVRGISLFHAIPIYFYLFLSAFLALRRQIADELNRLAWYLDPPVDVGCFIGGVPLENDEERLLQRSPHVMAAASAGFLSAVARWAHRGAA